MNGSGEVTDLVTGEAVVLDVRVARLPSRSLALLLDLLIQGLLLVGVGLLATRIGSVVDPALTATVSLTIGVMIIVGYPATLESLWRGRTIGKAALGLRVVGEDGGPERFRQALLRALAAVVEIWFTVGSVALISSLVSRHGRRLGDVFAGTLVVRERMPARGGPVATMPPQLAHWATGLELSGLSNEAAMTARQFLSRYHELAPQVRETMAWRIASAVAAQVNPPPPANTPPMAYVSAVLAERRRREQIRLQPGFVHNGSQPYSYPAQQPLPQLYPPAATAGPPAPPGPYGRPGGAPPSTGVATPEPGYTPEPRHRPEPPSGGFAPPG